VLTTLHAGGKFEGKGYTVSGGLHGVGVSVVNALSAKLVVEVERDGYQWRQTYERGKAGTKLIRGKPAKKTATTVTFWPDPEIFEDLEFKTDVLAQRLKELAYLTKGVAIVLRDDRLQPPTEETFRFTGGIADFVKALNTGRETLNRVIYF